MNTSAFLLLVFGIFIGNCIPDLWKLMNVFSIRNQTVCPPHKTPNIIFSTFDNTSDHNLCQSSKIPVRSLDFLHFDLRARDCSDFTNFLELEDPSTLNYFTPDAQVNCFFEKNTKAWSCSINKKHVVTSFFDLNKNVKMVCADLMDASTCVMHGQVSSSIHRHLALGIVSLILHFFLFGVFGFLFGGYYLNMEKRPVNSHLFIYFMQKFYFFITSCVLAYIFVDPMIYFTMGCLFVVFFLCDVVFLDELKTDYVIRPQEK